MFETPYNSSGFEGLMNFSVSCQYSRGLYLRTASFVISNHFAEKPPLRVPDESIAEQANLAENIRSRTDACTEMLNRSTNLLVVDFWSVGDTVEVVQEYNSLLPDITQSPTMSPMPSASPTGNPTEEPIALPTGQPTGQPTIQPTGQPTDVTATPSVISSVIDTSGTSSVTETSMPLDENLVSSPVSSPSVPSSAAQVSSPASSPVLSRTEVIGTNSPTLSPSYDLNDYTN